LGISVIIPTVNEAHHLSELIPQIQEYSDGSIKEIIIADAQSIDETRACAVASGASYIEVPVRSRATQMNEAAKKAKEEILLFLHADVRLYPGFDQDIVKYLFRHDAVSFCYWFDSFRPLLLLNAYFTKFNWLISRGGDQGLAIKKSFFDAIGGYDAYYTVMEDFDIIRRIKMQGTFGVIPRRIRVSARKYETNSWLKVQYANFIAFKMFLRDSAPEAIKSRYFSLLNMHSFYQKKNR
jgi:rSAM/selenodomain-associated transferase 2